jgi:Big-like domain-containing protein
MNTRFTSSAISESLATLALSLALAACGGSSPPPPPVQDFSLRASPVSASAVIGNTTSAVTVSVAPLNGFSGSVDITLQGLPSGVNASPGSAFAVQAGGSQAVTFSVSGAAANGIFEITISGTNGAISHSTQILLTTEPIINVLTYQNGSILYLESDSRTDTSRIGLQTGWGGSIVEISLNGTNFVNEHDTGREVQAAQYDGSAQYDGCAGCTGMFGWNPVQGGDKYDQGSPVLAQTVSPDSLYIKAQPVQWNPDDKGGGPGQPVVGDVYVEATITAVSDHAFTFKVHYKVTHFGSDQHTNSIQEFPAVYVNLGFDRFLSDSSTTPWTNAPLTSVTMPQLPLFGPTLYASEQWGAYVDSSDNGLTVFVPGMAPYIGGFAAAGDSGPFGFGTDYFAPRTYFSFGPNSVLEGDVYLVAGDYKHARQVIYDLHNTLPKRDLFTPIGSVDTPAPSAQLSGTTSVAGWAFDDTAVSKVVIYIDGVLAGTATYGGSRPDVASDWPHAPSAIAYSFSLDTTKYANGGHTMEVRAIDTSGNVAVFPDIPVTIRN